MNKQTGIKKLGERHVGGLQVRTFGMILATGKNGAIQASSIIGKWES